MPAVFNAPYPTRATSIVPFHDVVEQNQEGDWDQYLNQIGRIRSAAGKVRTPAQLAACKRDCALAYLGKRAQLNGGACNYTTPRILTTRVIAALEASNRTKRYNRYPWMEALMNIVAEIECMQDQGTTPANVISLLPATKYYRDSLRQDVRRQSAVEVQGPGFSSRARSMRKMAK